MRGVVPGRHLSLTRTTVLAQLGTSQNREQFDTIGTSQARTGVPARPGVVTDLGAVSTVW